MKPKVTQVTVARLFNTGNYEHVRVEIQADVPEGASASEAIIGIERALSAYNPKCPVDKYELNRARTMSKWSDIEWYKYQQSDWEKCKADNAKRLEQLESEMAKWTSNQKAARTMLDDLGAASKHTDAKLSWDDDDDL